MTRHHRPIRGRGTREAPPNRFESQALEIDLAALKEWQTLHDEGEEEPDPRTRYLVDASRSALSKNNSPDIPFSVGINPYRGCEHGCVYCLAPETPVLHADLVWRPIGASREGDRLVGFDEAPLPGRARKTRASVVERVWWSRKPTLRLITKNTEVITTADHRWLNAQSRWSPTRCLRPGHALRYLAMEPDHELESLFSWRAVLPHEPILAIEPGPVRDVVDIQTSTGTFFASGLPSHNCYARPTHEYLGYSAGLDFETKILVKLGLPDLLRRALSAPSWKPQAIAMSGVTDCYQPAERRLGITRGCLEVLAAFRNPVGLITKSALVSRDVDVLQQLAEHQAVSVTLSVTTLDSELARRWEPRAAQPRARLAAIRALAQAGIPVGVNVAPIVPGLNDHEAPAILQAAADSGARWAAYLLLRLPFGVKDLFARWLEDHYPERRDKVLRHIRSLRGGRLNDARFGVRMRGEGRYADHIADVFQLARKRAGLADRGPTLSTAHFRRPGANQLDLF